MNTQIVDNADYNQSDYPDVKLDHINKEGCCVINACPEHGHIGNDNYSVINATTILTLMEKN